MFLTSCLAAIFGIKLSVFSQLYSVPKILCYFSTLYSNSTSFKNDDLLYTLRIYLRRFHVALSVSACLLRNKVDYLMKAIYIIGKD